MAENNTFYSIDASVILKWFLNETEDKEKALQLQEDFFNRKIILGVPDYVFAEVLNTLGRYYKPKDALSAFSFLYTYNIQAYSITLTLASIALELIGKFHTISFYDAGYHAVALTEGGIFITADEKYYKKTRKAGSVMLLKQYK